MKIEIISRDKIFIQKIKEKFSQFNVSQNILFSVHRKEDDVRIENFADEEVQVVFIDADYVSNPIAVATKINELHPSIDIVFMASSCDKAYTYYEVIHAGFILKSDYEKYLDIIGARILEKAGQLNSKFIKVRWKNTVYVVENNDIIYIERDKRKTLIHTVYRDVYTTYQHIDEFVDCLKTGFLRIHFSYYVNAAYVKEFHRNHLILTDDTFVPISRKYAKEIKEYYAGTDMA